MPSPPVDRFGPLGAPVIVLLHGASLNRAMWGPAVGVLTPEFRVLAPDLPGHGTAGGSFTLEQAAANVAQLLSEEAPHGAVVAGDSLGGYVAMATAARIPDLVRGMIPSGCTARFHGAAAWKARAETVVVRLILKVIGEERLLQATLAKVRRIYPEAPLDAIVAGGLRLAARQEALLELIRHDPLALVAKYPGPVLFVHGADDRAMRRDEVAFLAAARHSRLTLIPGLGHGVSLGRPAEFARIVGEFARASFGAAKP